MTGSGLLTVVVGLTVVGLLTAHEVLVELGRRGRTRWLLVLSAPLIVVLTGLVVARFVLFSA